MSNHMKCVIHNIEYERHASPKTNTATTCPICAEEKAEKNRDRIKELTRHRDLLLEVIELKQIHIASHSSIQ